MQTSFAVTPMRVGEAPETALLIQRTIEPLPYYNERAKKEECAKYTAESLLVSISEDPQAVLVAKSHDRVVGFCVSRYDDALVWLSWFGVDAAYRRNGVGRLLVDALGATLSERRAHKIWCDTRTDNVASRVLLEEIGFTRLAEVKNHWYGQDFYLWEWIPQ